MQLKGQAISTGKKITVVKEADFFNGDPAAICSFLQLSKQAQFIISLILV